jgi:hypothetical protein
MEPECSVPCSQELATGSVLNPVHKLERCSFHIIIIIIIIIVVVVVVVVFQELGLLFCSGSEFIF